MLRVAGISSDPGSRVPTAAAGCAILRVHACSPTAVIVAIGIFIAANHKLV